jgi:diguanylate cyclase (GGDEF)-like protein
MDDLDTTTGGEPSSSPRREPSTLHVLVVDDDHASRRGLALAVRDLGHRCSTADDGEQALLVFEKDRPDVILSDWLMPRLNGLELCRRVRELAGPYVYFVFTSALHDKPHVLEGLHSGADDYLGKPIDPDELEARLATAARLLDVQRRMHQQNQALRRDSQRFYVASRVDPLTECKNRRALDEDLEGIVSNASRYDQTWALGMLDVDHFKSFNDAFGHVRGDEALKLVSSAIAQSLRRGDTLYRYGGEEFVVLLAGQDLAGTRTALERARKAVEELAVQQAPGASHAVVTVSAGGAVFRPGSTPGSWLAEADAALYKAKRAGRNRVLLSE